METQTDTPLSQLTGAAITTALTFDDVLLVPQHSRVMPSEVDISTQCVRAKWWKLFPVIFEYAISLAADPWCGAVTIELSFKSTLLE